MSSRSHQNVCRVGVKWHSWKGIEPTWNSNTHLEMCSPTHMCISAWRSKLALIIMSESWLDDCAVVMVHGVCYLKTAFWKKNVEMKFMLGTSYLLIEARSFYSSPIDLIACYYLFQWPYRKLVPGSCRAASMVFVFCLNFDNHDNEHYQTIVKMTSEFDMPLVMI